jgi:hypothetical protein
MPSHIKYPTFMVIGAQKCGTSWLANMISQHPEITVASNKEVHFFNNRDNFQKGIAWYIKQFQVAADIKAVGEFTPNYFWTSEDEKEIEESRRTRNIPELVQRYLPDLKLIVSLRDPVERAVSAYYHHIRAGRINPKQRLLEVASHLGIETMGYYDVHLRNWLAYYPLDKILILYYEEDLLDQNKKETVSRIFRHIGVADSFCPKGLIERYNPRFSYLEMHLAHYPRPIKKAIHYLIPDFIKMSRRWQITVKEEEKNTLRVRYKSHNTELQNIVARKLPWN